MNANVGERFFSIGFVGIQFSLLAASIKTFQPVLARGKWFSAFISVCEFRVLALPIVLLCACACLCAAFRWVNIVETCGIMNNDVISM